MNCVQCHAPVGVTDLNCPRCHHPQGALAAGTRLFHQYKLQRALHRSGGIRYLAADEQTGGEVLIDEFFPPESRRLGTLTILPGRDAQARTEWQARAEQWKALHLPGLRRVTTVFEQFGTTYVVSLPPDGPTLRAEVTRRGPLRAEEVQEILVSAAEALHGADLSAVGLPIPDHITLTRAGPLIELGWISPLSPAFSPPETLTGGVANAPQAAMYALGATAAFALTGHEPLDAPRRALGMSMVPFPVGTPQGLAETITACLNLSPDRRPRSFPDLRRQLEGGPTGKDVPPERQVQTVQVHSSWMTHLVLNGTQVISAGADQQLRFTHVDGTAQAKVDGLRGRPTGLTLLPHGLVAADAAGWIHLWRDHRLQSVPTNENIELFTSYGEDQVLAVTASMQLAVWQVDGLQPRGQQRTGDDIITGLTALPNRVIVYGTLRGQLSAIEPSQGARTSLLPDRSRPPIRCVTSGQNGELFYASGTEVFQLGITAPIATLSANVAALAILTDGTVVIAAGRTLSIRSLAGQVTLLHVADSTLRCVAINDQWIAAGTEHGQLIVLEHPPTEAAG